MVHLNWYDLTLFLPMAMAGAILIGAIPVATRFTRLSLRAVGAIAGALLALLVVEALPTLI
ncbi:hypothetical protein [Pandoraea sp.]|uniref:hypothetical protein n=1 Tax=Pandoraea sp. TaxID=1883445 RepID=UPI00122564A8|nr:hypothetical protein [Pandoraea sp.]MBU6491629.1 hypothetical protein [Burkholderiales bacterium]MDE2288729.1 hypothetical protein [Burkholderiales bacterium]MDE2609480.1 hypothetical protein [Burkholderiales bacterium]TAL52801.1 MAG: hypothetical protein EPN80_17265 [Pandoraea sp.]TAM19754.1 MAG: hypothetical protein EPN65_03220 [Pandoraea sp.]